MVIKKRLALYSQQAISSYLGIFINGLLHVLEEMVVGSALSLVDVDDAVQVGEVAIQVNSLGVAAAHEPVLNLPGLGRTQELMVRRPGKWRERNQLMCASDCCPIT